jgi:hypothetical protein
MLLHTLGHNLLEAIFRYGQLVADLPRSVAWHLPDGRDSWPGMRQMAAKFCDFWLLPNRRAPLTHRPFSWGCGKRLVAALFSFLKMAWHAPDGRVVWPGERQMAA